MSGKNIHRIETLQDLSKIVYTEAAGEKPLDSKPVKKNDK